MVTALFELVTKFYKAGYPFILMVGYPKDFYEKREILLSSPPFKCKVCDQTFMEAVIHHIDGDIENNELRNLLVCCVRCHTLIHVKVNGRKVGKMKHFQDLTGSVLNANAMVKIREYSQKLLHHDNRYKEKNPPLVL